MFARHARDPQVARSWLYVQAFALCVAVAVVLVAGAAGYAATAGYALMAVTR